MVKRAAAQLARDLTLYVAIAILFVGVIVTIAFLEAKKGQPPNPVVLNWMGLGGVLAIVYSMAIYQLPAILAR